MYVYMYETCCNILLSAPTLKLNVIAGPINNQKLKQNINTCKLQNVPFVRCELYGLV